MIHIKRELEMLKLIFQRNEYITINELASIFDVTERTVRDDLASIEIYLKDTNIRLRKHRSFGVAINKDCSSEGDIIQLLSRINKEKDFFSNYERENIILQTLLLEEERCTLKYLCEKTKSSRTTVQKDLRECESWLNKRNIIVEKRPHYGMTILYEEKNWRLAVLDHIIKNLKEYDFEKIYRSLKHDALFIVSMSVNEFLLYFVEELKLNLVKNFIKKHEADRNIRFTDEAFVRAFFYICISLKRIQKGKKVCDYDFQDRSRELPENINQWTEVYYRFLNYNSDFVISKTEICLIIQFLLTQTERYVVKSINHNTHDEEHVAAEFISTVENILSLDLSEDTNFYTNLLIHIRPTIYRMLFDVKIENPLKDEIKYLYSDIFKACQSASEIFYLEFGKFPDEHEISYLTMHVAASIEKIKKEKTLLNFFRIIVVCSSGVGTSNMLYVRLLNEFPNILIERICSVDELRNVNKEDIDFIISTTPLSIGTENPVIYVSPLLDKNDISQINRYMRKSIIKGKDGHSFIVDDLMMIIAQECEIPDYALLSRRIHQYFDKTENILKDNSPKLSELLYPDHIMFDVQAGDWKEAIKKGGELLYSDRCIEKRYIYSMIEAKEIVGEGIVIKDGIAFPHSKPKDGVNKICMSFITLAEPVRFGNERFDPVRIVICLGALESAGHLKALFELFELIEDKNELERLCLCGDKKQFQEILAEYENRLNIK